VADDPSWNFWSPASQERIVEVLGRQFEEIDVVVSDPDDWHRPTACEGWQVRDMVGHLVDATESFLTGFAAARRSEAIDPVGFAGMADATDQAARALRTVPRNDLLERLRHQNGRLLAEFSSLSADEWTNLVVPDRYAGPLPATAVATGLLGGYTVHGWDVGEGTGRPHAIPADAADLLVPFVFALWSVTAQTDEVDSPFSVGIRTTGHNEGETRIDVSKGNIRFSPAAIHDCDAVLDVDPGTLVLIGYGRVNAGSLHGDAGVMRRFRSLFRPI
jgi:uncharacterized protein (TIGR03083 family)